MHGLCSESSGLILELCGHRGSADFFVLGLWHAFFLVPEGELACRRAQQDRRIGTPANPHRLCPRAICLFLLPVLSHCCCRGEEELFVPGRLGDLQLVATNTLCWMIAIHWGLGHLILQMQRKS